MFRTGFNVSKMMRAVIPNGAGGIKIVEREIPQVSSGEELMKVVAYGVNRADVLQMRGMYPPPSGTTDVLGLEASGYLKDGRLISALLKGGSYAEYIAVPKSAILSFPSDSPFSNDPIQLAAIPEAFLAAYHVMFQMGNLSTNESVLINAAASGVGTSAIQMASLIPGISIIATASTEDKLQVCQQLGAHHLVNYKKEEISDAVLQATGGNGVNLLLDCVGAAQFKQHARSLCVDGRWVMYGLLSGAKSPDINLASILSKRLTISGTTLRSRSLEYRGELISNFVDRFGRSFVESALQPIIDTVFDGIDSTEQALKHLESNRTIGKVVVKL